MSLLLEVIRLFVLARSTDILLCIHERLRPRTSVEHSHVADARQGPTYDDCDCRGLMGYWLVMVQLIEFRFDFDLIRLIEIVIEIENFQHKLIAIESI